MQIVKLCKACRSKNINTLLNNGYYDWLSDDCYECPIKICGEKLVDTCINSDEYDVITNVSKDVVFIEAMIDLKEKDPIEFQLKLSQFKTNLAAQDASEKIQDNTPKCPTCSSKKIKKISGASKATSVALWGLFSQKVRRQWKCENCGYEW